MITIYTGTPGSGKSLHGARRIYTILRFYKDILVISNVQINLKVKGIRYSQNFRYYDNSEISPDILKRDCMDWMEKTGKKKEGQILIYLDEAQLLFNARTWQSNDQKGWLSFFTQHRKFGADVLMIAQSDRMIDRQIRSLIEYQYTHRKASRFGIRGILIGLLMGNFVSVGKWYGVNEKVSTEWFRYNKKLASLYDTYQVWE